MPRTRTTATRKSAGVRNNEPLANIDDIDDVEDTGEEMERLRDGMLMLSGSTGFRSRPAGHGPEGEQTSYDD